MTWAAIGAAAVSAIAADVNDPGSSGNALPAPDFSGGGETGAGGLAGLMNQNQALTGASDAAATAQAPSPQVVDQPATQPNLDGSGSVVSDPKSNAPKGLQTAANESPKQDRQGFGSLFADSLDKYAQPGPMLGLGLLQQLMGRQVAGPGLLALSLYDAYRQYRDQPQGGGGGNPLAGLLKVGGGAASSGGAAPSGGTQTFQGFGKGTPGF